MSKILIDEAVVRQALEALEVVARQPSGKGTVDAIAALREALAEQPAQAQEPVGAIRSLTDQCAALIQERDELQKQVWRYEKNGVTCQTYRHTVEQSCSECNVQMNYTTPPAQQEPLTEADYYNACLSYRHDFGLMPDEDRQKLLFEAKEWARAFGITKGNT